MTLDSTLQGLFDRLEMWFEEMVAPPPPISVFPHSQMDHFQDTPNSYKVCSSIPGIPEAAGIPEVAVFTTTSGQRHLPLPSPRYLEIHATRCKVVYMSGAADLHRHLDGGYPFVTELRSSHPVGSEFSAVLKARF